MSSQAKRRVRAGVLLLPLVVLLVAGGALADGAGCDVCVSVFKGLADLGDSDANCTLLAAVASSFFSMFASGLPGSDGFACRPGGHSPSLITACTTAADAGTAGALYDTFDYQYEVIFFALPFDLGIIDVCRYSRDDPYNRKNVSLSAPCARPVPSIKLPPTTSCAQPKPPPDAPAPPRCDDGSGRTTISLRKWLVGWYP